MCEKDGYRISILIQCKTNQVKITPISNFLSWPTARQPGRTFALPLTGRGWTRCWGAADVSGMWTTMTPPPLTNYFSPLTTNCSRKSYATQFTFFNPWFRTAHRHLMTLDFAPTTNFCSIKLHIWTIVNLSFACSTKTDIDYYMYFRLCSSLSILLQTLYILS